MKKHILVFLCLVFSIHCTAQGYFASTGLGASFADLGNGTHYSDLGLICSGQSMLLQNLEYGVEGGKMKIIGDDINYSSIYVGIIPRLVLLRTRVQPYVECAFRIAAKDMKAMIPRTGVKVYVSNHIYMYVSCGHNFTRVKPEDTYVKGDDFQSLTIGFSAHM